MEFDIYVNMKPCELWLKIVINLHACSVITVQKYVLSKTSGEQMKLSELYIVNV